MKNFIILDKEEIISGMNFFERYLPIIILVIIITLIFLFKERIRGSEKLDKRIRLILAIINILITLFYYGGKWIYIGFVPEYLPLHLCYICNIISIILLINKNKKLYVFLIFVGVLGGISSLISMDLTLSYKYFKYYYFSFTHINIVIVPLYFAIVHQYSSNNKEVIKAFIFLQILGIFMGIINYYYESNYFFVSFNSSIAAEGTILENLGSGYFYFINLEILAFFYLSIYLIINKKLEKV